MILGRGGGGLSVAFDMPTLMGRDSDDPKALGEVGHCGVAIDSRRRHGDALRRHRPRRGHHLDDDQRPRRAGLLHDDRRRRARGRRHRQAQRHAADRHLQGVHRPEGVALLARAAPAPHRRPDGVLRRATSRPTSRSRSPATTSARPARRPRRSSRSRSPTASATSSSGCRAASTSTSSPPACRSSSTATWTSSRRSPSSAPPAASGRRWLRDVYGAKTEKAQWLRFHTQTAGRLADRAAALQQRGPHRRRGARGGARRHQLAAHQRPRRDAGAAERAGRRDRAAHPAGDHGGDRRRQRRRPARRLLVRRGAHRQDRGRGLRDLRQDPRDGRLHADPRDVEGLAGRRPRSTAPSR